MRVEDRFAHEWKQQAGRQRDTVTKSAATPQAPLRIQVTRVAQAMPHLAVGSIEVVVYVGAAADA
jgi:hypothetical protein